MWSVTAVCVCSQNTEHANAGMFDVECYCSLGVFTEHCCLCWRRCLVWSVDYRVDRGRGVWFEVLIASICLCQQSTEHAEAGMFDAECVLHQIRSLQVTPTVQLMAAGTDMTDLSASHATSTQMQGHRRCSHNILVCVSLCERLATRLNNISYCTIIHSAWLRRKTSSWMSFGWQQQSSYGQSHQRHSFKNSFARNVRSSPHPPPSPPHTQRFLLSVYDTSIRPVMPYYISGKGVKKI